MATRLVNLKRALEMQIIPNRNRYAVGSEDRAKFDDLLSRLRNAENESEFNKVNNDFKTLTGRSDLVDIDSLTSAASEEFVEPVSIETEQETELQKLDAATEEIENLRVSAGQTTNPEELRKIQERAQSIYNSAFSTFSRNDNNDTLEQIASEHLETINSNLEIAQATQKFDEQTAEIEDLRVKAMNTSDARELNDILDRAQSIYTKNFPNNSNNESEQVFSDIAREHVEQISEMARTAESIAANAVEEEEIQPQNIDYDNPLSESFEINDTPSAPDAPAAPASPTDAPAEPEIFMGSVDSDAFDLDEVVQDEPEVVIDNNAPTAESIETNDTPSAPDAPVAPATPTDAPAEPEIFMGSVDSDAYEMDSVIVDESEQIIDNDSQMAAGIESNDMSTSSKPETTIENEIEKNELEVVKKLENLYKKIKTTSNQNEAYNISIESGNLLKEMQVNNHNKEHRDNAQKIYNNIVKEWFRVIDEIKNKRKFLEDLTNEAYKVKTVEDVQAIYDKAAQFRDEHFDIKIVSPHQKSLADEEVNKIYKRLIELRNERDNGKGMVNDSFEIGIGDLDFDSNEYVPIEQLEDLYKKTKKATTFNEVLELSDKAHKIREQMEKDNFDKKYKDKATELDVKISSEVSRLKSELNKQLANLSQLENKVSKVNTVEEAQNIYQEAAHIRDKYFDIKDVPKNFKDIADKHIDNIYNRYVNIRNERDEVIDVPDIKKDFNEVFGKVKITIYNGKHQETFLIPRGTNFKEPLPAIPVNKNGKPKKLTAKEFDGWLDEYGNKMKFPVVINNDFEIHASYKFDNKKALAVAAGAAVGGLAYVADLALPTPVPVISTVGSIGFKLGARAVNKKLANIQKLTNEHRKFTAQKIQDIQEPSPELLTLLETEKSLGHWKTFLNTAAIACGISAAAHGIKNTMDAKTQIIEEPVQPEPIVNEPIVQEPIIQEPIVQEPIVQEPIIQEPIIQPEPQQVLGEFDPTIGKVYKTANSALSGTGAGNPYMPAYQGQEIYQAFFNGNKVMIQPGQSIESILQSVGASDISEVAVNVMNANGSPLTWQPLEALVEGISQVR